MFVIAFLRSLGGMVFMVRTPSHNTLSALGLWSSARKNTKKFCSYPNPPVFLFSAAAFFWGRTRTSATLINEPFCKNVALPHYIVRTLRGAKKPYRYLSPSGHLHGTITMRLKHCRSVVHENLKHFDCRFGDRGSGTENSCCTVSIQFVVILCRNHSAHNHHDILTA